MANFNDRIHIFHCWRHNFINFTNCSDDWEALVLTDDPALRTCPICKYSVALRGVPGNLTDDASVRLYYAVRLPVTHYRQPTDQSIYVRCFQRLSWSNEEGKLYNLDRYKAWVKWIQSEVRGEWMDYYRNVCIDSGCPMLWENLTPTETAGIRQCDNCSQHYVVQETQAAEQPFFPGMPSYADFVGGLDQLASHHMHLALGCFDDTPAIEIYLEPVTSLAFAQLRLIRDIAHDTLNMLQLREKYCDQQRHLLIENADAEEAKAWLDEFIKWQTPFTVTSIRRGRWAE